MPNLIYTFFIYSLAIINYCNTLIGQKVVFFILISKVILFSQNNK